MSKRIKLLLLFFGLVSFVGTASAQNSAKMTGQTRNGKNLYVKLMGGMNVYGGDTDGVPQYKSLSITHIGEYFKVIGGSVRLEAGYAMTEHLDLALAGEYGSYPKIEPSEWAFIAPFNAGNFKDKTRTHIEALARFNILPKATLNPYVQAGANLTFGHSYDKTTFAEKSEIGYGPVVGAGAEVKVSNRLSAFVETTHSMVFPDIAVDGADYRNQFGSIGDDNNADWLSFYGAGLKMNLNTSLGGCTPVDVQTVAGPRTLKINEAGTFTSTLNGGSNPAEYYWDFGDGTVVQGMNSTHQFTKPGTYTVTFSATNCGGTDVESYQLAVTGATPPPATPTLSIVSLTPSPASATVGENIRFSADVRGTAPISFRWNFGDGNTSTAAAPSHVYSTPGTYTVILEAQNASGIDRRMQSVEVKKAAVFNPCDTITELNSVYFNFGTTALDANAQSRLMENVDVLKGCGNINVHVAGYTDYVEGSEMTTSQKRAQAVAEFYKLKGLNVSRFTVAGNGRDAVSCDKEDPGKGCRRNRRVESVPVKG